jgi:MFS family permease
VCLLGLVGFGHEAVIQPVLPLIVLERGGDAAFVGLLVAAFGIPTILLRPLLGRGVDVWSHAGVHRGGAALIAIAPVGYLLPIGTITLAIRGMQGVGWAAYGAATHALLAKIAPAGRRGEAAGYYNATHALAVLIGPATGLWLYQSVGPAAPFILASSIALAGLILSARMRFPSAVTPRRADPEGADAPGGILERSAIVPMLLVAAFQSVQSLFLIFAPIYAAAVGIPIEALALYYPVLGTVMLASQLGLGRVSDHYGRRPTVMGGAIIAIVGISIVPLVGGLLGLLLGAALYGVAHGLVTSTLGAATFDRARPDRLGAATATYSIGFQLGTSVGGAIWGVVIALAGYPWPYLGGAVALGACLTGATIALPRVTPGGTPADA